MWLTLVDSFITFTAKLFFFILRFLPEPCAFKIARTAVYLFIFFFRRAHVVGRRNLELAFPEKSAGDREKILRASYDSIARNLLAFSQIPDLTASKASSMMRYEKFRTSVEEVRRHSPQTSILFVHMHFGSFEFFAQVKALLERPSAVLARGFGLKRFDQWCNKRRGIFGNEIFFRRGGVQEAIRRLEKGQDVVMLIDQNVKANHACFVDFFGIKAATTKAVALIAFRTGVPVIFAVGAEVSPRHYDVFFRILPDPKKEPGSSKEQIQRFTQQLSWCMEDVIRKFPDHWFWIHRRFKTRPPGEIEWVYTGLQ